MKNLKSHHKASAMALLMCLLFLGFFMLVFSPEAKSVTWKNAATETPRRIYSLPENGIAISTENNVPPLHTKEEKNKLEARLNEKLARLDYDDPRPMVLPDAKLGFSQYLDDEAVLPLPKIQLADFTYDDPNAITPSQEPVIEIKAALKEVPYAPFNELPKMPEFPLGEKVPTPEFTIEVKADNQLIKIENLSETKAKSSKKITSDSQFIISFIEQSFLCTLVQSSGSSEHDEQARQALNKHYLKESLNENSTRSRPRASISIQINWIKL